MTYINTRAISRTLKNMHPLSAPPLTLPHSRAATPPVQSEALVAPSRSVSVLLGQLVQSGFALCALPPAEKVPRAQAAQTGPP